MPRPRGRDTGPLTLSITILALIASCSQSAPSASNQPDEDGPEPVAVTVFTDNVQLFMEYPRMVPGEEARFLAHVTVLETGEPVRSGKLRLELLRGGRSVRVINAEAPARDGLFIPVAAFDAPGSFDARIVVESPQANETIKLDPIVVYETAAAAVAAAEAEAEDDPPDLVPFLLEQQWKIGLIMRPAARMSLSQRLQVPGEVEVPQAAQAVIAAPMAGRLVGADALPQIGDRVRKGQVLGYIEPPLSTSDAVQLLANEMSSDSLRMELAMREFDVRSKVAEVEQAIQSAATRVEFAEKAVQRIQSLRAKKLGTVAELEAAQRDLSLALRARESAQALKASLAEARKQLEDLDARVVKLSERAKQPRVRLPVVSPIDGEIVQADHTLGESVESQGTLFRVMNLDLIWIATHVSEFDLARIGPRPGALLKFAANPGRQLDVLGAARGKIVHFARIIDRETRTATLRYEMRNPDGELRAGMFVDVFVEAGSAQDAVTVPASSIVMDNGNPVAFVLNDGESFQKRVLKLGVRDGDKVQVLSGVSEGERVVTKGAYVVRLAAASPASFGEGHAH